MKLKRVIAIFMCIACVLTLFGCSVDKPQQTAKKLDSGVDDIGYTIPYLRKDSLNPYKAENEINLALMPLLYDSLFSTDNSFKAVPLLAEDYKQTENKINVTLKSATFSDGSAVTAQDVVYSFVIAKSAATYKNYLNNLIDCSESGASSVVFTLANKNPYEVANLSFPIIKKGTERDENSSDSYSASIPVGSGRYTLADESGTKYLLINKSRLGGYRAKYNKIGLKDISELESIPNLFDMGELDFYIEAFSDGTFKRYSGNAATKSTTNLTFLGINGNSKVLKESKVRRAIALLMNRQDFASIAFADFGIGTSSPFHPDFYGTDGCTLPPIKYDKNAAIGLLEESGFTNIGDSGARFGEGGSLELRLAVNNENNFRMAMARSIQQALSKAGIMVSVNSMPYNSYVNVIKNGGYDLYIGEAQLSNSFDLSRFFNEEGNLSYGIDSKSESIKKYNRLEEGEATMQEFLDTFADELPFIPLAYRQCMTVRSERFEKPTLTVVSDYFYNVDEWTVK